MGGIVVEKHPLPPPQIAFEQFHNELLSAIDIGDHLKVLLENKTHYIVMKCKNIRFSYIPVRKITQVRMKRLMRRLIEIADLFKITHFVDYWFLLCDFPRTFPENGELFNVHHINGAYIYTATKKVYVYRLDDFEKVAIHELLHASVLDGLHANEAVIEAWAMMLYIEREPDPVAAYKREMKRALSLSHRLLLYQEKYVPVWKEKTPAYEYIRLKTCIMYYWKKFSRIPYPYDGNVVRDFLIEHNMKPAFIKKIRATPPTASLTMGLN